MRNPFKPRTKADECMELWKQTHANRTELIESVIELMQDKDFHTLTNKERRVATALIRLDLAYVEEGYITRKKQ